MDWERFGIYVFSAFYGYACLTAPYKGRRWLNRLTVFIILLLLMWLPACDDTRTITETEYVDRDVIVTEPYYTRTVYDENMGEFTAEQQDELRTKGYLNMRLFYSPRNAGRVWVRAGTPSFGTSQINSVTYGGGKFVAVGAAGKIAYSTDGDTWTQAKTPSFGTTNIYSVAYGNGVYVALADGKTATSSDGNTWTQQTPASPGWFTVLEFDGSRFISLNSQDFVYSTDGDTWTTISGALPAYMNRLQYGGGRYFAIGGENSGCYSDNMSDWTGVETGLPIGMSYYKYSNGVHVAFHLSSEGVGYKVFYSNNFVTWYESQTGDSASRVHVGNGRFFLSTSSKMYMSTNGSSWVETSFPFNNIYDMAGGNGRIVAVGTNGQISFSLE